MELRLEQRPWWNYLTGNQRDLLAEATTLLEREEEEGFGRFHDYSFIVFPAAKAYEGFLKKLFLDLGLITKKQYQGRYFRVGKSLNPSLPKWLRKDDWVYGKLKNFCHDADDEALVNFLWQTWRKSRNLIFHWFPRYKNFLTLDQARDRLEMIIDAIDRSFKLCKSGLRNLVASGKRNAVSPFRD